MLSVLQTVCLLPLSERLRVGESDHSIGTLLQAMRLVKLQEAIAGAVPGKETFLSVGLLQGLFRYLYFVAFVSDNVLNNEREL